MLSSLSYVCLGVSAGMWVISKGIYIFGRAGFVFHLSLAVPAFGSFTMNKEELVELLVKSQDAILERVDSKLQELKRSISEDQEECLSSVVKRVKEDNSIKWKKVGNEKQFKFNQSVEARFDSAISAIEKKKLDKAKKELEEVLSTAALSVSTSRISAQISVQETNLLRLWIGRTLEKQLPQSHFFRKIR